MATLAREVAPVLGEPDHPVTAALLSLLALDAALRFAGAEAVALAERAVVVARRHDDWLRTGPWLAWMLSCLIADRHDTVMVAAEEALARAIADNDTFAVAEWHAQLGVAHWMVGDIDEAQRLTQVGLALAEEIGADNLVMRNAFVRGASLLVPGTDPDVRLQVPQATLCGSANTSAGTCSTAAQRGRCSFPIAATTTRARLCWHASSRRISRLPCSF